MNIDITKYDSLVEELNKIIAQKQQLQDEILAPVSEALQALDSEFDPSITKINNELKKIEDAIRAEVLKTKEEIATKYHRYSFRAGSDKWNGEGLFNVANNLRDTFPEIYGAIMACYIPGKPTTVKNEVKK